MRGTCLVIRDGISQVLDEAVQGVGIVSIFQELRNPVLFGERFEPGDYLSQLPANNRVRNTFMPLEGKRTS